MTTPCVVLCSEVKDEAKGADGQLTAASANELTKLFSPVGAKLDGTWDVLNWTSRGIDGGNGGGGEADKPDPKFIYGSGNVGVWNFRYCRPDKANRDVSFPSAARIAVCAYFTSVGDAKQALDSNKYAPLNEIFENVLIVPLSKPLNGRTDYVTETVVATNIGDVSNKGSQ